MNKLKKGFTLVELIVVITILAILGTIAFLAFQSYSASARDSKRIADMNTIKTSLELFGLNSGKFPDPVSPVFISYSSGTINDLNLRQQGIFGQQNVTNVSSAGKLDRLPKDPLTEIEYTYSVTLNKKEFELGTILENDEVAFSPVNITNAASKKVVTAFIKGNYNGKILKTSSGTTSYIFAVPSIINSDSTLTDINELISPVNKIAYNGFANIPPTYDGPVFEVNGAYDKKFVNPDEILVFEGPDYSDLIDPEDSSARLDLLQNIQDAYSGTDLVGEGGIREIVESDPSNPTTTEENLAGIIVNSELGGNVEIVPDSGTGTIVDGGEINKYEIMLNYLEANNSTLKIDESSLWVHEYNSNLYFYVNGSTYYVNNGGTVNSLGNYSPIIVYNNLFYITDSEFNLKYINTDNNIINLASGYNPMEMAIYNNKLYFSSRSDDEEGYYMYNINTSNNITKIDKLFQSITELKVFNNNLYFIGDERYGPNYGDSYGTEIVYLNTSDTINCVDTCLSEGGTSLYPLGLTLYNNGLYFIKDITVIESLVRTLSYINTSNTINTIDNISNLMERNVEIVASYNNKLYMIIGGNYVDIHDGSDRNGIQSFININTSNNISEISNSGDNYYVDDYISRSDDTTKIFNNKFYSHSSGNDGNEYFSIIDTSGNINYINISNEGYTPSYGSPPKVFNNKFYFKGSDNSLHSIDSSNNFETYDIYYFGW